MKKLLKRYGFTLVELIVVVVILAVLASLAFMTVSKWIGASKDSNRISTIATLRRGMDMNYIEKGSYPFPDDDNEEGKVITGTVNGKTVLYKGTIGDSVIKNLGNIMKKTPLDPIGKRYAYGITASGKEYEIGTVLENETKLGLTNIAYGANYKAKLEGTYGGMIVFSTGGKQYIANIPSLVFTVSGSVTTSMNMISSNIYYSINSGNNLPYIVTTKSDAQKDSISAMLKKRFELENVELEVVEISNINDLTNVFSGTRLTNFGGNLDTIRYEIKRQGGKELEIPSGGEFRVCGCIDVNANECKEVFNGNEWGSCDIIGCNEGYEVKGLVCEAKGCNHDIDGIVSHNGNGIFYNVENVAFGESCEDHDVIKSCIYGVWTGEVGYDKYGCIVGAPNNCVDTDVITGGLSFKLISTSHNTKSVDKKNKEEDNGIFEYSLTGTCWNGEFEGKILGEKKNISCNNGYKYKGITNSCEKNSWVEGEWGSCSVSCGGGTQTRSVECRDWEGNIEGEENCLDIKPTTSQSCNTQSCYSYNWYSSGWGSCSSTSYWGGRGSCSVSCGGGTQYRYCQQPSGTQTRTVYCQRSDGTQMSDSYCSGTKPTTSQSCSADLSGCSRSSSQSASCNTQSCAPAKCPADAGVGRRSQVNPCGSGFCSNGILTSLNDGETITFTSRTCPNLVVTYRCNATSTGDKRSFVTYTCK